MQYLISVYNPAGAHDDGTVYADEAAMHAAFARVDAFNTALQEAGQWVSAAGLMPPSTAVSITSDGEATSGPYVEASHFLGGFWIVEASDLAEATDIARRAAAACGNTVELRQMAG